jgi:fermentation-respiration switch protein FrsA (DUF1100 family)
VTTIRTNLVVLLMGVVAAGASLAGLFAGCEPAKLDSFLYDPLPAPPGGYQLSHDVIPIWEEVHVATRDGETLQGYFIPSSGRRTDVTVIYFHGQSNNVGTTWPRLEYLYPLGYNLLAVDVRGYGLSTGTPDEPGIGVDVRAIWDALAARPGTVPGGIVIYGRSFGGALAVELAAANTPAVLITESAFASVAALVKDGAYVDFPRSFVARSAWDNLAKIGLVTAPYLALHGDADPYVLTRYAVELTAAHQAAQPGVATTLVLVAGADHGNVPQRMGLDIYRETIRAFVETAIPGP